MSPREMLILVPGVNLDGELFDGQRAVLEATHDVAIADNRSDNNIAYMAERLLRRVPERFALAGLSTGGYVAQEVMRQAPHRVLGWRSWTPRHGPTRKMPRNAGAG